MTIPFSRRALILALAAAAGLAGCGIFGSGKISSTASTKSSGPPAPDVMFKGLDGKDVSVQSLKGKVVLLNFWATWCEPCREDIPWMIEFQQKYANKGFTVVGVAMDDEGKSVVEPFVQKEKFDVNGQKIGMNYPIVLGNDDLADQFGGIWALPTTLVISRDGKIVKRFFGLVGRDSILDEVERQL